jgi:hypothetical protein
MVTKNAALMQALFCKKALKINDLYMYGMFRCELYEYWCSVVGSLRDTTWIISGRKGNSLGQESQIGGPAQKKSKGAELRRKQMDYRRLFIELNQPIAAFGSCVGSGAL